MKLSWIDYLVITMIVVLVGAVFSSKIIKNVSGSTAKAVNDTRQISLQGTRYYPLTSVLADYTYSVTENDPQVIKMMEIMGAKHVAEGETPDIRMFRHVTKGHKEIYMVFQCHGQEKKALQQTGGINGAWNPYYMDEVRRSLIHIAIRRLEQMDSEIVDRIKR